MIDIFDMMGPVMVGPSSSHTAGAARIGAMGRTLLGEEVAEAKIGLQASSIGGGAIVVNKIDGINVNFTGEFNTLIVRNQDEFGSVAAITSILSQLRINVANMSVNRHRRGGDALMVIETDQHIKRNQVDFLAQLPGILSVTYYDKEDDEDGSGFDEANL